MNSDSLRTPAPESRLSTPEPKLASASAVMLSQLILLRRSGKVWLLIAACVAAMIYVEMGRVADIASMEVAPGSSTSVAYAMAFRGVPPHTMLLVQNFLLFFAMLWPLVVWKGEYWGQRDYHWSLPVQQPAHDLMRVLSGAIWLAIAVLCAAAVGIVMQHLHGTHTIYLPDGSHLHMIVPGLTFWLGFLLGPFIVYSLVSVLAVGTRRPAEWMVGLTFLFWAVMAATSAGARSRWLSDRVGAFLSHELSIAKAIAGGQWLDYQGFLVDAGAPVTPDSTLTFISWISATLLWLAIAWGTLALAARRRG